FCYFDAFLSSIEPKTYKEALEESCWIEAMQEELHKFERLEVWELVPRPEHTEVTAPVSVVSTSTPSSTSVDQDAPLPSTSQTSQVSPSHVNSTSAEEADHDIKVAHMGDNP
nr:Gag-Pol polyprotein [Tanacetum cinerariifolium]